MTREQRQQLLAQYADGVRVVEAALAGFPADRMADRPFAGKWSAREIVHHLGDSESNGAIRIRKLMTEERPLLQGYDQEEWARRFKYNERVDIRPSLDAFRNARATTQQILPYFSDADWARIGWHTESGVYPAEHWLEIYGVHAHGHADQITRLKQALTK